MNKRVLIGDFAVDNAFADTKDLMDLMLQRKGRHTFASKHEALGLIEEERHELVCAIHENKPLAHDVRKELLDIAVVCIFAVACIDADAMEW